jgi:hypothetical protein
MSRSTPRRHPSDADASRLDNCRLEPLAQIILSGKSEPQQHDCGACSASQAGYFPEIEVECQHDPPFTGGLRENFMVG